MGEEENDGPADNDKYCSKQLIITFVRFFE